MGIPISIRFVRCCVLEASLKDPVILLAGTTHFREGLPSEYLQGIPPWRILTGDFVISHKSCCIGVVNTCIIWRNKHITRALHRWYHTRDLSCFRVCFSTPPSVAGGTYSVFLTPYFACDSQQYTSLLFSVLPLPNTLWTRYVTLCISIYPMFTRTVFY